MQNPGHVALFHSALELEREREQRQREQLITQRARERNSTVERIMTLAMRALQVRAATMFNHVVVNVL